MIVCLNPRRTLSHATAYPTLTLCYFNFHSNRHASDYLVFVAAFILPFLEAYVYISRIAPLNKKLGTIDDMFSKARSSVHCPAVFLSTLPFTFFHRCCFLGLSRIFVLLLAPLHPGLSFDSFLPLCSASFLRRPAPSFSCLFHFVVRFRAVSSSFFVAPRCLRRRAFPS